MAMKKVSILLLIFFSAFTAGVAQAQQPGENEPQTLDEQFNHLKKSSNTYETYKVVKEIRLNQLWKNVMDSVSEFRGTIAETNAEIATQQNQITGLQKQINNLQAQLEASEYQSSRISILGLYLLKNTYNSIMWGIIGVLAVLFIIGFVRFRRNEKMTRKKVKDFEELSEEFEEYRKIVRQREIRIKRELQTASNKLEEMRHRTSAR